MTVNAAQTPRPRFSRWVLVFALAALVLLLALLASLALGASEISLARVARLLFAPDDSTDSLVVHALRLPRTLVAGLAGAGLGVSGLLLQGVTRNPLADPGILGVEAGGAFAILVMVVFFPAAPAALFVPAAFGGQECGPDPLAAGAGRGGGGLPVWERPPTRCRSSLKNRAQGALFALSGSVAGRTWEQLWQVAPWLGLGLGAALVYSSRVNVLALGEDVASSLGSRTARDSAADHRAGRAAGRRIGQRGRAALALWAWWCRTLPAP